ncbi:hypothetical protein HanIR_Chr09g0428701 [Helianthus annuus]|nr:hypothetical protein HanIR_Chr09g0428701 [Helianthus annuus]
MSSPPTITTRSSSRIVSSLSTLVERSSNACHMLSTPRSLSTIIRLLTSYDTNIGQNFNPLCITRDISAKNTLQEKKMIFLFNR